MLALCQDSILDTFFCVHFLLVAGMKCIPKYEMKQF